MRSSVAKDKTKAKDVAVIRLKREGQRFELKLHRDMIPNVEKLIADPKATVDYEKILVDDVIFANAAKGEAAKSSDLVKAFKDVTGTKEGKDVRGVMRYILEKGDLQKSQEDRKEHQSEAHSLLVKIVERICTTAHVLPTDDIEKIAKNTKVSPEEALKKIRLVRYSPEVIERELKNVKFKPKGTDDISDAAADGIHALWLDKSVPILRDAVYLKLVPEKKSAESIDALNNECETLLKKGYFRKLSSSDANALHLLVCNTQMTLLKKALEKSLKNATLEFGPCGSGLHIPLVLGNDEEELASVSCSSLATAADAPPAATAGKKASGKKAKNQHADPSSQPPPASQKKEKSGDDSDDEEASALEAQLAILKGDDSDDGKKGKGKGKGKKGKAAAPAPKPKPKPQQPQKKKWEQSSEDDSGSGSSSSSEDDEPVQTMKPKKKKK